MTQTLFEFLLLPAFLGLLGFIEPCTIGGHLVFLETQERRGYHERIAAVLIFVAARALVAGLFGAVIAFLGARMITVQTGIWWMFGVFYLLVGAAFMFGRAGLVKHRISLSPSAWKRARSPVVLGLAFGLNIPACAAPILFGLLGLAATTGTALTGFAMMFVFGLFLSSPLILFAAVPGLSTRLETLGGRMKKMQWLVGAIFVMLGLWSIWFGLYVDPANWAGK